MDADSSYGGSDTAQDSHSGHDNSSSLETTHNDTTTSTPQPEPNNFYHKNEVTLPVNYDETDFQESKPAKQPHYLSTANLNINDTLEHHSNLEEMSKNYKSTSYLNESPRIRKKADEGVDNPAFQEEEYKPEVKSTFDNNKPYNGDLNSTVMLGLTSPNKNEEPLTEAVNLELINLKPAGKDVTGAYENGTNGMTSIPVKKENDAEIGNPYDEYFVPVNEHRKYMRGEKLYVTMDKRNKKKRNKCLCWGLCLCIVAAAVIIGILAAVGVIGNQGPIHEVSARHFGSGPTEEPIHKGGIFGLPKDINDAGTTPEDRATPKPPMVTVSSFLPTTDTSMIQVPRALESQLVIDNLEFNPALADKNSTEYKKLAEQVENVIKNSLFSSDMLQYGSSDIEVKVMDFSSGSVVVNYRITWVFKEGIHNTRDPINEEMLKRKMRKIVDNNNGFIDTYHVVNNSVSVERIIDSCKINNNGCEHNCSFDYKLADFVCSCPDGKHLNMDGKTCANLETIIEHEDVHFHDHQYHPSQEQPEPEPTSEPEPEPTSQPEPEPTSSESEPEHHHTTLEPQVEPSPEPTKDHEHHFHEVVPTSEPEPTSEPVTEPKFVEPNYSADIVPIEPESEPTTKTEEPSHQNYVHFQEVQPGTTEGHVHYHEHVVGVEPEAEPTAEPKSEPSPEPTTPKVEENESNSASSEKSREHEIETVAEPTAEHKITEESKSFKAYEIFEHTSEPAAEPTAEPAAEPTAEPAAEPTAEPAAEPTAEPATEPTAEPAAKHNVKEESKSFNVLDITVHTTEPAAEPTAEPAAEPTAEPSAEPTSVPETSQEHILKTVNEHDSEPAAEPTAEPAAEPTPEPTSIPEVSQEHTTKATKEHDTEPVAELTAEPAAEPTAEPTAEPAAEPTPIPEVSQDNIIITKEHKAEPVAEPTAEPAAEHNTEPAAEPVPSTEQVPSSTSDSKIEPNILIMEQTTLQAEPENKTELNQVVTTTQNDSFVHQVTESSVSSSSSSAGLIFVTTIPDYVINKTQESTEANKSSSEENVTNAIVPEVPVVISEKAVTTEPSPTTTQQASEPSTKQPNEDNLLVPVHIHEQPRLLQDQETTQENQTVLPVVVPSNTTEVSNNSVVLNDTNIHMVVVESTENTSGMDNMSPFLPEIDNDTFVNKLHLGEHIYPHVQNETHEDEISETVPPRRLDNDQMNMTNPQDTNVTDASLKVIPLGGNENEILDKITITTVVPKEQDAKPADSYVVPVVQEEAVATTVPNETESTTAENNNNQTVKEENTTTKTEDTDQTGKEESITLSPEIINNVHSNIYFENVDQQNKTVLDHDFSTSTEDLIALETTTNRERVPENKVVASTELPKTTPVPSTVHAEILDTVTDSVRFETKTESQEVITTTAPLLDNTAQAYEVNEAITDFTTTEKLFLSAKPTEVPIIQKEDEDLSVVPLASDEDNETKVYEKRVVHDLESEDNNSVNDISTDDQVVSNRFNHNENDISAVEKETDSSTSKIEEATKPELEPSKYDESKLSKKNYYDKEKPKYEKKVKLEKVISTITDDEILTPAVVSDTQPHPFSDIRPVTEDFAIPDFARCSYGQFHCVNGTSIKDGSYCIPENDRCDSVDDCSDGSDEIDCVQNGCPNNFQCASGQCLKRHLVCDGIQNCNDGSDESGCENWTCRFDEFSCGPSHRCLPILWKCDGRSQCPDGTDEHNCPTTKCNDDSFHCTEQNTCIPKTWRCDGENDCISAEDESSCECGSEEFKCTIGGGCIKTEEVCDGTAQCADQSDEWNCVKLEGEKKQLEVKFANNSWYSVCSLRWNQTHSDQICRELGHGGSSLTEEVPKSGSDYLQLKTNLTYGSSILSQLEKTDSCDSIVAITCQEFACGSHSTLDVHSARIIGGNRGVETQWPSLTLLYNKKHNVQCTATLVAPTWVMASYSCIYDLHARSPVVPMDWILYAGSTNFFSSLDNSTTQVGRVQRILPHPQAKFSQFEYANDAVLVELEKPLTMTRNVSAMCLPENDIEPRQLCVIAGWGVSKPGEPSKNQYLHYLPVPVIDSQECNSTKHYNGLMGEDKICAGYTDSEKTPCYNDEGAPLMCFSDSAGTWELQGILSHHDNCAKSKHPAIYTSINERMRKWVINTIGQKPARSA